MPTIVSIRAVCGATLFTMLFCTQAPGQIPFMTKVEPKLLVDQGAPTILGGTTPDGHGGILYSDIDNSTISRIDISSGDVEVFDGESGGANDILFDSDGFLWAAEGTEQRITKSDGENMEVVVDSYNGLPFNAPNDLVFDNQGGLYFTDPAFFADVQPEGVYYLSPAGDLTQVISDLERPNGIVLSPDETKLYVSAPTAVPESQQGAIWEYDVTAPGVVENPESFASGFFDGITIDIFGNVFGSAFTTGVKAFDPEGNMIFNLTRFPSEAPGFGPGTTNVGFEDPSVGYPNTLYVPTWFGKVYSVELKARSLGDVDENGVVDIEDLNDICSRIASPRNRRFDPNFEIEPDGAINMRDVERFLEEVGSLSGDANLDGTVDFADFLALSAAFGNEGSWEQGDFGCNGMVEFADFLTLSSNFGNSASEVAVVPEPTSKLWLLAILCFLRGGVTGDPPIGFGVLRNLGKQKTANLP